jgi:hypothetical protein
VSLFCFLGGVYLVRPWGWGFFGGFGVLGVLGGVRCRIFWKRIFFSLYAPFLLFYAFLFRERERVSFRVFPAFFLRDRGCARVFRSFGEIARTRRKNMVFSQV